MQRGGRVLGRGALTATAVLAGILMAPATAPAALTCGKTLTKSVKLKTDLTQCPGDGLIAGASDIRIDLNGHRITGAGLDNTEGISVSNRLHVVIKGRGGRVVGLDDGIRFSEGDRGAVRGVKVKRSSGLGIAVGSSDEVKVDGNRVIGSAAYGIEVFHSSDVEVTGNRVIGADTNVFSSAGMVVNASDSENNLLSGNKVTPGVAGDVALWLNGGAQATKVKTNVFTGFPSYAVAVYDGAKDTLLKRNEASGNGGNGLQVQGGAGTGTRLIGNEASDNGGDGIEIEASGVSVGENVAEGNGGWGIVATPVVTDLGGNHASGNTLGQCSAGIAC